MVRPGHNSDLSRQTPNSNISDLWLSDRAAPQSRRKRINCHRQPAGCEEGPTGLTGLWSVLAQRQGRSRSCSRKDAQDEAEPTAGTGLALLRFPV